GELHEARAAVAHGRHQREQRVAPASHGGEVRMHLLARRGFKAHYRLGLALLERRDPGLQLADAARVAALLNLAQQHRRRYPARHGLLDASAQVVLVHVQLARAWRTWAVPTRLLLTQVAPHRVARAAQLFGN